MVAAFAPSISSPRHHLILKARADSSDAINEALKISSKYGNDSKEARVAWDIVEEMDACDNV